MAKIKDETTTAGAATPDETATAQYQYVGSTISIQVIAGAETLLTPGQTIALPSTDPVVARLVKQALLIPHTLRRERHG